MSFKKKRNHSVEMINKLSRLVKTRRDQKEIEDWILSLAPLGVAFVFFVIFVLPMDLPKKNIILVSGVVAGLIGLQSYWIFRGWRKDHGSTVLLGIVTIVITLGIAWYYLSFGF